MKKKIYLTLIFIWAGLIFYFSNQPAVTSSVQSSMVIDIIYRTPLLGELLQEMDNSDNWLINIDVITFLVRKSAHMFLYFVLVILNFLFHNEIKYRDYAMRYAFLVTILYACTDEIHQLFIPGRAGRVSDVFVDTLGALVGIGCIAAYYRFIGNKNEVLEEVKGRV